MQKHFRMDSNSSTSEETGVSEKKASSSTQDMNDASGAVADDREDQIRLKSYRYIWKIVY